MANIRGVGVYETVKGWFRGGFWRTNHRQGRLFLLFLIILCTLISLGASAPLPNDTPRPRNDTILSNATNTAATPATKEFDTVARHRRGAPQRIAVVPPARHNRNQKGPRGGPRNRGNRKGHTISPRNTVLPLPRDACFEEVSAKTYLADTVFDGKARSRSPVKNGVYNVTFVVQSVFKGGEAQFTRSPVRLQFAEKKEDEPECPHSGLVKSNIKRGRKYVVFVDKVGPHSFVARGEPVIWSKINVQAVKEVLCPNCVRKPVLSGLSDVTARTGERLRLVCRTKGTPLPLLHWYKDGARLHKSRDVKIRNKKRRTTLVVGKLTVADAGRYECRALSVTGATDRISALVAVNAQPRHDNTTPGWRVSRPCPIEQYCMNDGQCKYFETVGELSCSCAEGFKGTRCEEKDVYNRANGSTYLPLSYFCKLGITSSFYC